MSQIQVSLLRKQLQLAHQVLEDTLGGLSTDGVHWQARGYAHSIAANYAHVIVQEDVITHVLLSNTQPLFASRFAEKTGLSAIPPLPETELVNWSDWGKSLKLDLTKAQAYAQAVYAATDAYLASVTDEELAQSIDTGFLGEMSKLELINLALLSNCNWHTGEISAVKGLQDLIGYPF